MQFKSTIYIMDDMKVTVEYDTNGHEIIEWQIVAIDSKPCLDPPTELYAKIDSIEGETKRIEEKLLTAYYS